MNIDMIIIITRIYVYATVKFEGEKTGKIAE
jgi:hypothetical protein